MSTTTKKKTFGDTVKGAGSKVKGSFKKYKDDIQCAHDYGYAKGWDNAYSIPNRFGAKTAAANGFKKGLKQRMQSDKYIAKYNKKGGH